MDADHSSNSAPDHTKAALKQIEDRLTEIRRYPLWFVRPVVWRLRAQRDELRLLLATQKAERTQKKLKAKSTPKPTQPPATLISEGKPVHDATLIVTAAEINDRHGTGVLLARLFKGTPEFIHVRSMNLYGGETSGALRICLPPDCIASANLADLLKGSTVSRILSVPYSRSDVENTLALQAATGAPLCVWLMDHNLGEGEHQIPFPLMQRLLNSAHLRLGISPEFCALYAGQFGYAVHFAPPVVDAHLGQNTLLHLAPESFQPATGVLLGNVWSQRWLKKLANTVAEAKVPLVAFGHKSPHWVKNDDLASQVNMRGFLPEDELVAELRRHPFAIVPTGTLDEDDDLPEIARYSLPSRTLYLSAVGNLPIIVTGHADSGVARFVTRHGLGVFVPYDGKQLRRAIQSICQPEQQLHFRRQAAALAPTFACDDMHDWLWKSLDFSAPADERWQSL